MLLKIKRLLEKLTQASISHFISFILFAGFTSAIVFLFSCDALTPGTTCVGVNEEEGRNIWQETTGQNSSSPLPFVILNTLFPNSSAPAVPCSTPLLAVSGSGAVASASATNNESNANTGTTGTTGISSGGVTSSTSASVVSTGSVDTTFGTGAVSAGNGITIPTPGVLSIDIGANNSEDAGMAIAIQTDGKIIVGGKTGTGVNQDLVLLRFNPNGTLDTSYGSNGRRIINIDAPNNRRDDFVNMQLDSNGKLVVLSTLWPANNEPRQIVSRYNVDGTNDTSFNGGTSYFTNLGTYESDPLLGNLTFIQATPYNLKIAPNGKIVVNGFGGFAGSAADSLIARLNADGTLDTTFGVTPTRTGKISRNLGGRCAGTPVGANDDFRDNLPLADGKILAGGEVNKTIAGTHDVCLTRHLENGDIDTTFGGGDSTAGYFSIELTDRFDSVRQIILNPSSEILVACIAGGAPDSNLDTKFAAIKLSANGVLDTSFGNSGKVLEDFGTGEDISTSIFIQPDGKILLAGYATLNNGTNTAKRPAMLRLNANGTLDTTFGTNGKVSINSIAVKNVLGRNVNVARDPNSGSIFLVGSDINNNIILAKFN